MNGKQIKVIEYNLTFGSSVRLINVLGLFRYKKNNNLYIVYTDVEQNNYNIIYYGSSHIKDTSVLSMECKDPNDKEIIKEYIYKVTNNEDLSAYEFEPLDKIEGIEIISSNKIEVNKESLNKIIDITIPKKEEPKENTKEKKNKKKSGKGIIAILLLLIIAAGAYYLYTSQNKEQSYKQITCNKTYKHETLNAEIEEEQIFNFDINDKLEKVNTTKIYKFNDENVYYDFINTGTYYSYMPEEDKEGGWDKNDDELTYKTTEVERIKIDYKKPTDYEEVLSYYKNEQYKCEEKVIN